MKILKCTRCGICCLSTPCDGNSPCKKLIIHKDKTTSCKDYDKDNLFWKSGCFLRHFIEIYEFEKSKAKYYFKPRPYRLTVRTSGSQPENIGSIPVGVA
uniref:Uncharacterized protein n=1 Tax=viral metagenome TaxID=1070528 RepID=A0A6M3L0J8_9ZZZZ